MIKDDYFYLLASNEFANGKDEALWAKILTIQKGNLNSAKTSYIKQRAHELLKEKIDERNKIHRFKLDSFDLGYISISFYSSLTNLTENEIIDQVNKGSLDGIIKNNSWFISRSSDSIKGSKYDYSKVSVSDIFVTALDYANFSALTFESVIELILNNKIKGVMFNNEYVVVENELPQLPTISALKKLKNIFTRY